MFLNTVRGALVVAEAELSGKDGQINNISEALDDIRGLLAPVSVRHQIFSVSVRFQNIQLIEQSMNTLAWCLVRLIK